MASSPYEEGREYDIIFAGGGTAACVAAGRLANADPSLSILIVERGRNNLNDPTVTTPALFGSHFDPNSRSNIFYQAESEPALDGRARVVMTGGILGGGSSTNAMMYTRAQGVDYDSFEMEGWDSKSLLKYAKKLETVHLDDEFVNKSAHGFSGPVNITFGSHAPKGPMDDFMDAAQSYGFPEIGDLQDFEAIGGFNRSAKYIGPDGTRQDAAHRYVHPLLADGKHPNLHLLLQTRVRRVLFEGTRAVGLEYEPEPVFLQENDQTERIVKSVTAKRLVVVSAGALGTPSILERSGVGDEGLLSKLDIPVVSHLPGVGENYQDHHFLLCPYKTNLKEEETLDGLITGRRDPAKMFAEKDSFLTWNGIDIGGKLRITDEQAASLGPKFEKVWKQDFANSPTKPIMLLGVISAFLGDRGQLDEEAEGASQFVTMASYTPYPYSRGSIHITSADALVPAKFLTGFLADKDDIDLKKQVWAYKIGRDIYRRTNAFAGELAIGHPRFREGSKAALSKGPIRIQGEQFESVEDRTKIAPIEYDDEDDRAIEQFIRSSVETTWHSLGTCKMAPREKGGVVDQDLNVYGTEALKCVDLSIIPENVAANTNNTALIVGEKAADIVGKELGIDV